MATDSDILYNFAENHDGLDHIGRVVTDIHTIANDVHKVFQGIADLWSGQTPEALQAAHQRINTQLEDYLHAIQATGAAAGNQQDEMQALDSQLAGGF
ncbi:MULTISPECIES: WXG100 family type VII secretion target [Mycobacterium]|uniref:ESAT-6-like protein n=1 Tax=Mycobacterium kiyosense TaxID=2871094 RepID=A0A9P3QEE7_9MYCO|nr:MULTISPECIES: WXG100 family type VII secretion target [Mycobacterium]BDB43700.1 hypothetical protein IWGMT90018_41460 [Mycobacterium kiyosense]BDE15260.1 hypothetical protein MKCMC460_41200 [Mycobacterium sp. 20KCMC460]GLB86604.1 hypothetical protein SRL2020028_58600 [Mycobacterium kiyosense]GLB93065.1 hypothetical protein SRL2020130_58820 [Mycobacterium kiyosense]GLB99213.1 hypothetical protein SRL2020226_59890 [Mycobacterium kiyosense]